MGDDRLRLTEEARNALWSDLIEIVEGHWRSVDSGRVAPPLDPDTLRNDLAALDLLNGLGVADAVGFARRGLTDQQVHTAHRRYFGLFNPSPTTMGVAADTLVAAFNPQLAAWSHSPFAAEVERYLVREIGVRFGFEIAEIDGVFASGGAEANHTAVLTALVNADDRYRQRGVDTASGAFTMYLTPEAHDSLRKAASISGLGFRAVREVPVTKSLRMDLEALRNLVASDRAAGFRPFLVVGTAGTTSAGIIDPLTEIADVANAEGMWFHVDAAWGGAAALSDAARPLVAGIERADSVTFDAHKWLSVPMGAGMYVTRHPEILTATFGTEDAYMPRDAAGLDVVDPFRHSIQWSRRFTGLKLFLTIAVAGWHHIAVLVEKEIALGQTLRSILSERGWRIVNQTQLPVVCFADPDAEPSDRAAADSLAQAVVKSGKAWISSTVLANGDACLRACITNFETDESDLVALAEALDSVRHRTA